MILFEVAGEISGRLANIFKRDARGRRGVFGHVAKFQNDSHWRDYVLVYNRFHGDDGSGRGASHQAGGTGGIAKLIQLFASIALEELLADMGRAATYYRPQATADGSKGAT